MEDWPSLMLRPEKFTTASNHAAQRYTAYLEGILASYNRIILSKALNVSSIKTFKDEAEMLNKHYLEREVEHMVENYHDLETMIKEDTSRLDIDVTLDEDWATYLSDNANFSYEIVKLQSTKDALYATNFLRAKVIEVINMNDFDRAYNLLFSSRDLAFFYTDKIGRKVNSVKYIRTLYRDFFVKNYNDLIAGAAILNGIDKVTIINTDIHHGDHDKIISVNDESTINYWSIRNDSFHPNTNSIIRV
jgi:hypothetical protein